MPADLLETYVEMMKRLNIDRAHGPAPHKPVLLLSVIALIESGQICENRITVTPELAETFAKYWLRVTKRPPNIAMPFFHLRSDGFWHHHPMPECCEELKRVRKMRTLSQIYDLISHVRLDENLFVLLSDSVSREKIRQALIRTYFPDSAGEIETLISEEKETGDYRQQLLKETEVPFGEEKPPAETNLREIRIRNAGFRRVIMRLYDYTCAVCKLRIVTAEGNSATEAAHIIPHNVSNNDDVRNGVSLCALHHWAFDQGLISLSEAYRVIVSGTLSMQRKTEWLLTDLRRKKIRLPDRTQHRPAQEAMAWHRENKFRKN